MEEELELYMNRQYLDEMVKSSQIYQTHQALRPLKTGVLETILRHPNLQTKRRSAVIGMEYYIPIIVKCLLINKESDCIYLIDERYYTSKDKISIPGGHLQVSDFYDYKESPHEFLISEWVREFFEEGSVSGYSDFDNCLWKTDINEVLTRKGFNVLDTRFPVTYSYTDKAFTIYLSKEVKPNAPGCNDTFVKYSRDVHNYIGGLLRRKVDNKQIFSYLAPVAKDDIRINNYAMLVRIFDTYFLFKL